MLKDRKRNRSRIGVTLGTFFLTEFKVYILYYDYKQHKNMIIQNALKTVNLFVKVAL